MTPWATPLLLASLGLLGGCASVLNGVGGSERYACRAPSGTQCTSVSGTYANAPDRVRARVQPGPVDIMSFMATPKAAASPAHQSPVATGSHPARPAGPIPLAGTTAPPTAVIPSPVLQPETTALRSAPRVLRLWIAPWEDSDGDLHEASKVHVLIDTGRWLIERVRPTSTPARLAVRPPHGSAPGMGQPHSGAYVPADASDTASSGRPSWNPFRSSPLPSSVSGSLDAGGIPSGGDPAGSTAQED